MSLLYDDAQRQIADDAQRLLDARFAGERLKELLETKGQFDETFWRTCGEQGWTAVALPEEHGGLGMGLLELGVIAEACGAHVVGAPFLTSSFGFGQAIARYGSDALRAEWLPRLAAGEAIGAVAFAEGQDVLPLAPALRLANGRLTGFKPAVTAAARADAAVVYATGEHGTVLAVVALDTPGVAIETLDTFDNSRCTADVRFDGAEAVVLEGAADAAEAARTVLRLQAVIVAHEQVGGAQRMMTAARDYALTRRAFGQPIGAFQSVKHRIAEDYVWVELARANAIHAAGSLGTPAFPAAAAAARITATEAYDTVSRDAMQTHGGIGVTWEADFHLHQRRARTLAIETGPLMFWEDELVDRLAETVLEDAR